MRRGLVLTGLLVVAAAACSSSAKSGTTAPTNQTSSTTSSGGTSTTGATVTTKPEAPVTIDAYVLAVDLKARTITVDPMAFLTGTTAKEAFKHDHPDAQEGPPNDYYISNPTKDRVLLQLAPNVTVRLVQVGGIAHTQPVPAPLSSLAGYRSLSLHPFTITATNGSVDTIVERFVP